MTHPPSILLKAPALKTDGKDYGKNIQGHILLPVKSGFA